MAVKKISKDDLESAIRDTLDADMCFDIVQSACSEYGDFEEYDFMDSRDFFACFGNEYSKIADLIDAFYSGTDLDTGENGADPYADYLRWTRYGGAVDSITDPAQFVYDDAFQDIVEYIMDNLDYDFYPEEIMELINEYKDYSEEDEEDEE